MWVAVQLGRQKRLRGGGISWLPSWLMRSMRQLVLWCRPAAHLALGQSDGPCHTICTSKDGLNSRRKSARKRRRGSTELLWVGARKTKCEICLRMVICIVLARHRVAMELQRCCNGVVLIALCKCNAAGTCSTYANGLLPFGGDTGHRATVMSRQSTRPLADVAETT